MTFEKVQNILSEQLGVDPKKITVKSLIEADLGADSLDVIELIMAIEDEFDLKVSDDAVLEIKSVGDLVNYIEKNAE